MRKAFILTVLSSLILTACNDVKDKTHKQFEKHLVEEFSDIWYVIEGEGITFENQYDNDLFYYSIIFEPQFLDTLYLKSDGNKLTYKEPKMEDFWLSIKDYKSEKGNFYNIKYKRTISHGIEEELNKDLDNRAELEQEYANVFKQSLQKVGKANGYEIEFE